jgi:photosystem II stability/assembly factor-like uncharacterized protein
MKKCMYFVLTYILLSNSTFGQWQMLSNSGANVTLYSVVFIDQNTGWAVGWSQQSFGKIISTTNGGSNWVVQPIAIQYPFSIFFVDHNTGWVVGSNGIPGAPILKTTNSGNTWVNINAFPNMGFCKIYCLNNDTCWIVGGNLAIAKTVNGGMNWSLQNMSNNLSNSSNVLRSVYFINGNTGWAVGGNLSYADTVLSTTNGGINWFGKTTSTTNELESVYFVNSFTGWCVGYDGIVIKTTNGGENWNIQVLGNYRLTSVLFCDTYNGWISGLNSAGIIYRTTNSGENWFIQYSGGFDILSLDFATPNTGWAVGYGSNILKTSNGGGIVGLNNISEVVTHDFLLAQNYPNPFNPLTKIKFDVPANVKGQTSSVKLVIYDLLGREVTTLVNEELKPGTYEAEWDGSNFSSGVYFYKIISGYFVETKKMILMK